MQTLSAFWARLLRLFRRPRPCAPGVTCTFAVDREALAAAVLEQLERNDREFGV